MSNYVKDYPTSRTFQATKRSSSSNQVLHWFIVSKERYTEDVNNITSKRIVLIDELKKAWL